jgi:hypothetical protein
VAGVPRGLGCDASFGAVLFLGGGAAALFLDELFSLPDLELVGAASMLSGALLTWHAGGDRTAPPEE